MYPEGWAKFAALHDLRRLQPDVLPAVHPRLHGHAAALSRVPAGVSGAERDVDGRGVDPGRRLCRSRSSTSSGRSRGARSPAPIRGAPIGLEWETASPPPIENFPRHTGGDAAGLRLRQRREESQALAASRRTRMARTHTMSGCSIISTRWTSSRRRPSLGMWIFLVTEVLFFGGMFMAYILYRTWYPEAWAAASHHLDVPLGAFNTAVLIGSSLHHGAGRARLAARRAQRAGAVPDPHDHPGLHVPRGEGHRVSRQVRASPRARPALPLRGGAGAGRRGADLLLAVLRDDRHARDSHDRRRRPALVADRSRPRRARSRRDGTRRSSSSACTGTSSTSSGSSCSRCSTWSGHGPLPDTETTARRRPIARRHAQEGSARCHNT